MGQDFDENEMQLEGKLIKLILLLGGTPSDLIQIINTSTINDDFLKQTRNVIDRLGGSVDATTAIQGWRRTLPDKAVLSSLDRLIEIAQRKAPLVSLDMI